MYNSNRTFNYSNKNNSYSEDDFEEIQNRNPSVGTIGAIIGAIPGCILWIVLAYFTPFASLMAILITFGALEGFLKFAKYMTYRVKNNLILLCILLMVIINTGVTSYTLYMQYTKDVLKQSTIDELRESFVTNLKNNGKSIEETEAMLKQQYGINGFNDIDGLNTFVKKTLADTYKDSHKVSTVPDTPVNAVICLFQSLAYNRTIGKPFFFNILGGIVICILIANALISLKHFKPKDI